MNGLPFPAMTGTGPVKVWLACGATDMRKGFDGLAVLVQQALEQSPHSGALFAFRGKRGDLVKLLWYGSPGPAGSTVGSERRIVGYGRHNLPEARSIGMTRMAMRVQS